MVPRTAKARSRAQFLIPGLGLAAAFALPLIVPTEVQQPGTQPLEVSNLGSVVQCDNCHGGYDLAVEPAFGWKGSTMAQAGRDPLFWATVALAEGDFPGAGDLCIRCHSPRGWLEGRSSPTDGSALVEGDAHGVECFLCHLLTDPDGSEWQGVQNAPFLARTATTPPRSFRGSGMFVLWGGAEFHGPYSDPVARHSTLQSRFLRSSAACGTCHDVSNAVTGDLAPGNGHMQPLPPGSFSGQPGSPVTTKAAFLAEPHRYGVVERTYSEHVGSSLATTRVGSFASLPVELQDGAIRSAHDAATRGVPSGDYADGAPRTFTCQTCHMPPAIGKGCNKRDAPLRPDLPRHDLTGGNGWIQDAIVWLAQRNRLVLGNTLDGVQLAALTAAKARASETLRGAARVAPVGNAARIVNLTGHKLLTGYPEGRRLWLNVRWFDRAGLLVREDGAYGPIAVQLPGRSLTVESIQDLDDPRLRLYEAQPGITQGWASRLLGLGLPAATPLGFDRVTGAVRTTLGDAAAAPVNGKTKSFRFVLNDTMVEDSRIPPYGFAYDEALRRGTLPVPATQFGDPGPGGIYRHRDEAPLDPPANAVFAEVRLLYQPTSWEYVQFLFLANQGAVPALATTGADLLDAWLATGMAAPQLVADSTWCVERGTGEDLELTTAVDGSGDRHGCRKTASGGSELRVEIASPRGGFTGNLAAIVFQIFPTGARPASPLPGIWFDRSDLQLLLPSLPAQGAGLTLDVPSGAAGISVRIQGIALALAARNGLYASTDAHDLELR